MNNGYTKLFSTILASTIWQEDDKTRLIWITMLAMSNRDGLVYAAIPGLAHFARVEVEDVEAALEKFLNPEENLSVRKTQDHEGRRIEVIEGGWRLLNHAKYRDKMNKEEQAEKSRLRMKNFRAKNK